MRNRFAIKRPQALGGKPTPVLATWDIRSSTRSTWEYMRSREEDSLVGRDVVRACCQWQPQLSKKRDFLPSMVPRACVPYSLCNREQGERNKICPRLLSGLGHDRGTDRNRRASDYPQEYCVTGSHDQPLFLFHISLFSYCSPLIQEWIFEVASTYTIAGINSAFLEFHACEGLLGFTQPE